MSEIYFAIFSINKCYWLTNFPLSAGKRFNWKSFTVTYVLSSILIPLQTIHNSYQLWISKICLLCIFYVLTKNVPPLSKNVWQVSYFYILVLRLHKMMSLCQQGRVCTYTLCKVGIATCDKLIFKSSILYPTVYICPLARYFVKCKVAWFFLVECCALCKQKYKCKKSLFHYT